MPEPAWARVRALFEAAVELPAAERERLLRYECGGDAALRLAVERLLTADEAAAATPAATLDRGVAASLVPAALLQPGETFAAYRIVGVLGQGGMGTVFRAVQERPAREVALKVLRAGVTDVRRQQRLLHEAELLGRLQHPGIAQVFEAALRRDSVSGEMVAFFAMELVEGARTLDRWVATTAPDLPARLRLFTQICDAVQHGHQRAVLHRDLKPGNVLVDAAGRAKVIDFGIARATDAEQQRQTLATAPGQLLGTLAYMSPEQLAGDEPIDARADIYALGVLLHELVSGELPFDPDGQTLVTFAARVANDVPPPPSRTAGTPVELDWIVGRCLAKERDQRYGSVAELAADVRAFLADEPVRARAPSTTYLLRTFIRRHRVQVAAGAAVLLAVVVGGVAASIGWYHAAAGRATARAEAEAQAAVTQFLADMIGAARAERDGADVRVIDLLAQAEKTASALAGRRADIALGLRNAIANTWQTLGRLEPALAHLQAILPEAERRLGQDHPVTLHIGHSLGVAWSQSGRLTDAERQLRQALAGRLATLGADSEEVATTRVALATVLQNLGRSTEAAPLLQAASRTFSQARGENDRNALHVRGTLARLDLDQGRHGEAVMAAEAIVAAATASLGPDDPLTLDGRALLAQALLASGRVDDARKVMESTLSLRKAKFGATHRTVLDSLNDLAAVLQQQGQLAAAETCVREVCAVEAVIAANPVQALVTRNNLAVLLERQDKLAEAEACFAALLPDAQQIVPAEHLLHGVFAKGYAVCLTRLGRFAAAEQHLLPAIERLQTALPPGDARLRKALEAAVSLYEAWGKPERAGEFRKRLGI